MTPKKPTPPGYVPSTIKTRPPTPKPSIRDIVSAVVGNPRGNAPKPTGPMVPVRGGAMMPQSQAYTMKKGGKVKCMAKGGSASKRADGCATKGKTKGKII